MKILITGCQGFIGKSLAHHALHNGHQVLGVARSTQSDMVPGMGFSHCALDRSEFIEVLNRFAPDVVFHAAGSASVGYSFQQPREDFLMAVETWGAVLDAVRKAEGNPLVMFPSSASVYGNPTRLPVSEASSLRPISPYGFHKVICEQLAQEYCHCFGLNVVVARLFSTVGPYQQRLLVWELFRQAIDDMAYLTIQGTGTETRDFLHIQDICRYFLGIMERQPKGFWAVNVASGRSTSVRHMAEIVTQLAGSGQGIVTLNKDLPGDPKHWQADITLLQDLVPHHADDITKGIEDCVRYWMAEVPVFEDRTIRCSLESKL
ncbi:MAG: UDP-glucose 4-epimerase [Nitrospira sp.]|jgi:UDP-glucose 4-epimerase|nr:UDP-glucose 4-epimerase [Nitrospira sp.]